MALDSINPIDLENKGSFSYYEKIAESKNGEKKRILYGETIENTFKSSELFERIKEKYKIYDEHVKNLELLVEDNYIEEDKKALKHCYDSSTKALKSLKKSIIENQSPFYQCKCAYCGIDGISAMDHYIPKEKFPEYAVHPHNLIPACSFCNGKKSDLFLSEDKTRIFFNPYFDEVDSSILSLKIDYLESTNSFSFKFKVVDDSYKAHIDLLGIISRYEKEAINVFDNLRMDLLTSFEVHIDMYDKLSTYELIYKKQLKITIDTKLRNRGINSLDYLVYDSFYNSKYCNVAFFINHFGNPTVKLKLANKTVTSRDSLIS